MKFNFKNYIKENYLNESITSNIFITKLLNDTGGMFKYYISPKSKSFQKMKELKDEMHKILSPIISLSGNYPNYNSNKTYMYDKINSDEKVIALYNKYMDILKKYIKEIKNIFVKPDPLLFKDIINDFNYFQKPVDLFNINDSNFETYLYSDIKKDQALKTKVLKLLDDHIAFFISEDNKIQAVTNDKSIVLLSIDNMFNINKLNITDKNPQEYLDSLSKRDFNDFLQNNQLKLTLQDGTVLNVPMLKELYIDNIKQYYSPNNKDQVLSIQFIYDYLMCDYTNDYLPLNRKFKIGQFFSKSSVLQKNTDWGKSLNDYIIIYTAEQAYKNTEKNYTSKINKGDTYVYTTNKFGYNDILINPNEVDMLAKHRNDVKKYVNTTYKWIRTLLGKYLPYARSDKNKFWSYEHKLTPEEIYDLYGNDKANSDIAYHNIMRYKDLLEQTRTIRNLGEFNDQIKPYLSKINVFVFKGKQLITKIKSFSKTDVAKFCSLTLLYRTYNSTLNMLIYNYSKSLNDITIFNDEYSVKNIIKMKKEGKSSAKITEELKKFKKNIEDSLNNLDNYLQTVKELDKKIDELLNE